MAGGIVWTRDTLTPNLVAAAATMDARLSAYMDYQAAHVQDYMRANAPWTDRTANARNGLFAKRVAGEGTESIVCYHTVPYGIWLEVRHNGRFAIIVPTILHEGARIMKDLGKIMKQIVTD